MWFDFQRSEGFPTQFAPQFTPVNVDVLEAGFICAFFILILSFFISIPSIGVKKNVYLYTRVTINLLIGLFLLLGNFGQEWEVAHAKSKMPYRAGTGQEINATIGVKIGLRSVNVTLRNASEPRGDLMGETIDYNERFGWTWDQGRFGFGPYAGELQQEFRMAQIRGLPIPILWVVEYFVIDGEGFRFGRFYRTAGWYCHILMWTAFACWLMTNILLKSVIRYGAYFLLLTGCLELLANLVWTVVRNPSPLMIPFEDDTITTKYGSSYWITFVTGIICVTLAVVILIMDNIPMFEEILHSYFDVDPLNTYEIEYVAKEDFVDLRKKVKQNEPEIMPLADLDKSGMEKPVSYVPVYKKRGSLILPPKVMRNNKPTYRNPPPVPDVNV